MPRHVFDPTILRDYDIRGIVGETLFPADAYALGRTLGTLARETRGSRAVVGRDGRLSSPELEAELVRGLSSCGIHVTRLGVGPTPLLYYAAATTGADIAVSVTGSHNPPDHNGFKILMAGTPVFGPGIRALGERAARGGFADGIGAVVEVSLHADYVDRVLRDWRDGGRALTVVWDAGNGAAGEVMTEIAGRLPGRHILLNQTIDGTFPAHHPDPTDPASLTQLIDRVIAEGADLGIAFDGDGDRIGVVDGRGHILWGDQILQILAEDVLARHPGATIIADVKASRALFDEVARLGGRPLMWKSGHSHIKSKMAETKAPLAGEMSGHIFFADGWYGFDDALYAAVRLLSLVARLPGTLADRFDAMPVLANTPELRFPCPEERKFQVIREVQARLEAAGAEMVRVDGVRVTVPHGWWLLRASHTQAMLVARAEADTEAHLAAVRADLDAQLRESGLTLG